MKYLVVRCEDHAAGTADTPSPLLEGAKLAHLHNLAHAGAAGTLRLRGRSVLAERFPVHQGLLGIRPSGLEASAGRCLAARLGVPLAPEETAWCVTLLTQQDGRVADPTAGGISTNESRELLASLNQELGTDSRRWIPGEGALHLLVVRDPAWQVRDDTLWRTPESLIGQAWVRGLPRHAAREPLQRLLEQGARVLDAHPVNRVRIDLGENPANGLWVWGPGRGSRDLVNSWAGSGAIASSDVLVQGLARVIGWPDVPATDSFTDAATTRLTDRVTTLIEAHDLVYVHLAIAARGSIARQVTMERLDRLLRECSSALSACGAARLLALVDDRSSGVGLVVASGTGVAAQPIASLKSERFAESPLRFTEANAVSAWLRGASTS